MNPIEKLQIAQHEIRFCDHGRAEAVSLQKLQTLPCQLQFFFAGLIRVAHRSGGNDDAFSPFFQNVLQQRGRVALHLNILKRVRELIAFAPAVAVDAAVRAPAVEVHAVLPGQKGFRVDKMHTNSSFSSVDIPMIIPDRPAVNGLKNGY